MDTYVEPLIISHTSALELHRLMRRAHAPRGFLNLRNIISVLTRVVMIHAIKQLYLLKRLSKAALLRVLVSKVHFLLPPCY